MYILYWNTCGYKYREEFSYVHMCNFYGKRVISRGQCEYKKYK